MLDKGIRLIDVAKVAGISKSACGRYSLARKKYGCLERYYARGDKVLIVWQDLITDKVRAQIAALRERDWLVYVSFDDTQRVENEYALLSPEEKAAQPPQDYYRSQPEAESVPSLETESVPSLETESKLNPPHP